MTQPPKDMSSDADEKLSGKQALALHTLYEYTRPGGLWMRTGRRAVRTNTLDSLERRGLAAVHGYMYAGELVEEWQITEKGQAWIEDRPVEA